MIFEDVRNSLLVEAKNSPNLLSDLAGLEEYIAESYHSRSFTELLQNADDANASKFKVKVQEEFIIIANNGRLFNKRDFESLCRSANSIKIRGESIGYRGIGFKSVVGFSGKIHLFSGDLQTTFSKELTKKEVPLAQKVPLIRIPHPISSLDKYIMDSINNFFNEGYTTIFVFEKVNSKEVELEFESFSYSSLLFLNNVKFVEFETKKYKKIITAKRTDISHNIEKVTISYGEDSSNWITMKGENKVAVSFFINNKNEVERLDKRDAVVHAFLPTEEMTGLGVKINGDVSTDPSRRNVILDSNTDAVLINIAKIISDILLKIFKSENVIEYEKGMIEALIPNFDPRTIEFKNQSFSTELLKKIKKFSSSEFNKMVLKPNWINYIDFEDISEKLDLWILDRKFKGINNINSFLKFLGANEIKKETIIKNIDKYNLSLRGCVEFISYLINMYTTRQIKIRSISTNWKVWIEANEEKNNLDNIISRNSKLKREFVESILEKVTSVEFERFMIDLIGVEKCNKIVPNFGKKVKGT